MSLVLSGSTTDNAGSGTRAKPRRDAHESTSSSVRGGDTSCCAWKDGRRLNISKSGKNEERKDRAHEDMSGLHQSHIRGKKSRTTPSCWVYFSNSLSPFSQLQIHFQAPMRYKCKEERGFNIYRCSGGRQLWSLKHISNARLCLGWRLFFQGESEGKKTLI